MSSYNPILFLTFRHSKTIEHDLSTNKNKPSVVTSQLYDHLDAPQTTLMTSQCDQEGYSKLYRNGQDCVV